MASSCLQLAGRIATLSCGDKDEGSRAGDGALVRAAVVVPGLEPGGEDSAISREHKSDV